MSIDKSLLLRPEFNLLHPVLGCTEADHQASIAADKDRNWQKHICTPASNWFLAVETGTKKVVGGAQWLVNTSNPFPNDAERVEADMWPVGPYRDFATEFLNQYILPKKSWMRRPHLGR